MPLVTTVIDDKSPLIVYDASWLPGSAWDDQQASNYYLATFTTNNVTNGSVSFNFNGTGVWLYGAKRSNHGSFVVQVDSQTFSNLNGNSGPSLFQQSLFYTSVNQGMHSVKLTNTATGSQYVDIDIIVWQSEVGSTNDQLVTELLQDTDPRFQYQEPAWVTTSSDPNFNLYLFNNASGHITTTNSSIVTFTFTAVSLFGTSGPSNGPYSVQLDGGESATYNATNAYPTNYGVLIYHADNLGPGSHEIVLTNLPASGGQSLAIDYAQLFTIANTTTNTTSPSSSTGTSQNSKVSSGAIAGIVIAAVAAVFSAGLAFLFYRRWKDALATHQDLYRVYALQRRGPPESSTVPPTGFSSTLETRSNASLLRNDNSAQPSSGRTRQPADSHTSQYDEAVQISPGSRDSQGIIVSVSSPTQSPVDEDFGRRPLPDAPGGGLSLADELPKLAGPRRGQDIISADHSSIAGSEAPPNYTQAIRNR